MQVERVLVQVRASLVLLHHSSSDVNYRLIEHRDQTSRGRVKLSRKVTEKQLVGIAKEKRWVEEEVK